MNNLLSMLLQATPAEQRWLFQSDKVYTVLAVVLIIWAGIVVFLVSTHLRIGRVERALRDQVFDPEKIRQDRGKGEID